MAGFPMVGDVYADRYRISRELGHGGLGIVYEAHDTVLDRPIALKVVVPSASDREDYQRRFAAEASVLAQIRSRHVLGIHEYGEHEDTAYVVTELIPDGSLARWLVDHGPLDRRAALVLVAEVCEALVDAHAVGVVHGDVQPGSVLLWNRPDALVPYVADFALARDGDGPDLTPSGHLLGAPAFMPPERHFGHPADVRGDVYAVGCLLWAALAGTAPYSGTDFQMMNSHINDPVPQLGTGDPVDEMVDALLLELMAKQPDQRPDGVAEVRATLLDLVAVIDAPDGTPTPTVAEPGERPMLLAALVLVVLAVLVGVAALALG